MPQCNPTPLEKHPPLSGAEQQPFLLHAPPHPPHTYKSGSVQPAAPSNISPPSEATSQRATPCNTSGVFPPILSKRAEEKTKKKTRRQLSFSHAGRVREGGGGAGREGPRLAAGRSWAAAALLAGARHAGIPAPRAAAAAGGREGARQPPCKQLELCRGACRAAGRGWSSRTQLCFQEVLSRPRAAEKSTENKL